MRVLHLISSGGMYGAEAVILNLSTALNAGAENRSLLGVFSNTAHPNLQLHHAALKAGVESHLISCRGQIDRSVPAALRELVRQTQADVVHAHGYKADVYTYLALRSTPTPLVSTCHTWYDNDLMVRLYGILDRWTLQRFDGVVAVSPEVQRRLLKAHVRQDRIRLIQNGIDLAPFAAAERIRELGRNQDAPLRIGLVGRLAPEKGVDIFLRAAVEIVRQRPATRFSIAGDGPDRAALEQLIVQLGLSRSTSLLGRTDDMPAFYSSIDIQVSASRQEGLPITLLEGMASGLPVVATSVGAVPQVVHDGETGLLVEAGNPVALAAAILQVIDDPSLRASLGDRGRRLIAAEFSADRMAAEYINLYRNVLAERIGRAA
jgi:glycosyltransferase involved in cell wall biosynthesis